MVWIGDFSPVPPDPQTDVRLWLDTGIQGLNSFAFRRFQEGIPREQTLIRVQTVNRSLYVLWYIGVDDDGAVAVVVQSDSHPFFRHPRIAFYERLDGRRTQMLSPAHCIQRGECLHFISAGEHGELLPVLTSPVQEQGITLLIGADVSRFVAATTQFQAVMTKEAFAQTVWTELISLPEPEMRAVNRIVRGLSLFSQGAMREILREASKLGRLEVVASELIRLYRHRSGNDDFVTQSVMGYLQKLVSRE